MPTPDEIRESELGDKAKILGCSLRRSPSTDVWSADYGCLLVYETPDCSGEFTVSKISTDTRSKQGRVSANRVSRNRSPS